MIARLKGVVVDARVGYIVLDVGGVGYLVAVRIPDDFKEGETIELRTHLAVRENAMDLYGFLEQEELDIFELLLRLPKIGPKSAMQILSQADVELLKKAVLTNDPGYLTKMSGIGKKSAEKIVEGLKDIFDARDTEFVRSEGNTEDADVVDALIALGYSQKDARDALTKLPQEITGANNRVREALRQLGK